MRTIILPFATFATILITMTALAAAYALEPGTAGALPGLVAPDAVAC